MNTERKISLPAYKMAYAAFFTAVLSLIRGVTYTHEIGIALEAPMALLAAVFCADTYTQEFSSGRSEVWRLYPMKNRLCSIRQRLLAQELYLFALSAAGYGMFFVFQSPMTGIGNEAVLFAAYLTAAAATLPFWSLLSHTLATLLRNMWAGIGVCLVLWLTMDSTFGDRVFGPWNLFSYTFRSIENGGDYRWLLGKLACLALMILLLAAQPIILKKRG